MRLITADEVVKAAEEFIRQYREDFPISIRVEVIDLVVPGQAMLLLMEKPPVALAASFVYITGVALLRLSKNMEEKIGTARRGR